MKHCAAPLESVWNYDTASGCCSASSSAIRGLIRSNSSLVFEEISAIVRASRTAIKAAARAKVDVRAKVDAAAPYKTMHTFRATSETPMAFVSYPLMEFELRDNDAGNTVTVWAE